MNSLSRFHVFPRLPNEVKEYIWQDFILDANQDRLVVLSQPSEEIMPTRFLSSSPFCINRQSRTVFKRLYPVKRPVFRTYEHATFADDIDPATDTESDSSFTSHLTGITDMENTELCGDLYLSLERDLFLVVGYSRTWCDVHNHTDYRGSSAPYCMSPPLELSQSRQLKHLMEIVRVHRWEIAYDPTVIRHLGRRNNHRYGAWRFEEVQTCQHIYWNHLTDPNDLMSEVILLPGSELLEKWEAQTIFYDKKMLCNQRKF